MSSLVAEVLKCASSGTLDRNDLQNEIICISRQMESFKLQVQSVLSRCYLDFDPLVSAAVSAEDTLRQLDEEANSLKNKIRKELKPQLNSAVSEYEDLALRVQKTGILADLLSRLVAIREALQGSENALINKEYLKSSQFLDIAGKELSNAESYWQTSSAEDLNILQALKTDFVVQREKIIFNLGQLWSQNIVWIEQEKSTFLRVYATEAFTTSSLTQALESLDQLNQKLKQFSRNFMVHFIGPILRREAEVVFNKKSLYLELGIRYKSEEQPTAQDLVKTLESLFVSLSEALNTLSGTEPEGNHIMQKLGKVCSEEFCSRLIKECLEPAVPSQSKDFLAFKTVTSQIDSFQSLLQKIGFLSSEQSLSYAQNFDSLFASKRCQEILMQARETMREELHTIISSDSVLKYHAEKCETTQSQEREKLNELKHAFHFPKCQISVFTKKILNQLHEVLEEAASSNNKDMAVRLFYTAKHLSQMYCDVVPIYHQDSILLFPQQTAVHHNNCMFLSHHLTTLSHSYEYLLSQKGMQGQKTFIDVALQLRTIGTESFLQQMRRQRTVLLEFLQDHGVFQNMSSEELLSKGRRAVKQCLIHLLSLKKVWLPVLPWEVYLRSLGTLCNSCLEEIIFRIVSQDDITEKTAGQLTSILSSLDSEMPKLFEMPNDAGGDDDKKTANNAHDNQEADWRVLCMRHIKKWAKFQEIRIILKSSLRDIVERWANGQGPLASEATSEEVKQLIRALFQNTDRRAAALAKIK